MRKFIVFAMLFLGIGIAVLLSGFVMPAVVAIVVLAVAILSDSTTTWLCMRKKGREGNPVVAFLFRKLGFLGTWLIWLGVWGAIFYFRIIPSSEAEKTAIAIAYWIVPLNNLWVYWRLNRRSTKGEKGPRTVRIIKAV